MNIKNLFSILVGFFLSVSLFGSVKELSIPPEIINGIRQGKAEVISQYFKNTVELTIDNQENIYSKTQAQLILKDFFKKNPPSSFKILHEGGKGDSKYAIGSLKTPKGQFRITILIKSSNNKPFIQQLRIENDGV